METKATMYGRPSECNSTSFLRFILALDCSYCCLNSGVCGTKDQCEKDFQAGYILYGLFGGIVLVMCLIVYVVSVCRQRSRATARNSYVRYLAAQNEAVLAPKLRHGV